MNTDALPDFVTPITMGGDWVVSEDPLSPEDHREIDRRCRELVEHRAQALVSGRDYLIVGEKW